MALSFQRTTIFCRDMAASLRLYRDALGLTVVDDKVIEGPAAGGLLQLPPCRLRIVLLKCGEDEEATIGLFELSDVELDSIAYPAGRPAHGQTALVLATDSFDAIYEKLEAGKVRFLTPPLKYPKSVASPGSPAGVYREMIFYDPDDLLVSVMQIDPLPTETHS